MRKSFLTSIILRSRQNCTVLPLDLLDICLDLVNVDPDLLHVLEELVHLAALHTDSNIITSNIILV